MFRRTALTVLLPSLLLFLGGLPSAAHEERESVFPDQDSPVPTYRPFDESIPHLVVCKPTSEGLIGAMPDGQLKELNEHLLEECGYQHLQAAVDAVAQQGTNIYVLPGHYREEPSWDPPCIEGYDGGVVEYDLIFSCGEVVNLITIAGDDPNDGDRVCDQPVCNLQIEGTGQVPQDVRFTGGFREDGDWVKHNVLKADRADGIYLRNMTFELARENAVYIHETDGYVLDKIEANFNDLYGILTFASDHGVIRDCVTHHNGDSGIYPGSAADVNADSRTPAPLDRWAVEIFGCDSYFNALGFSGTAGNSVYFHDNWIHDNGAGYVTDSFIPNHPGMPVDHPWLENNHIFRNNTNYFPNVREGGPCRAERPADRGHQDGVVCPAFLPPVGTGIVFAGVNFSAVRNNQIYDNWRAGAMLLYVPPVIREEYSLGQFDVSHGNQFVGNHFGEHPSGAVQPNGVDFWWDDQGHGNCWQDNTSAAGAVTNNFLIPVMPDCDSGGSGLGMAAANDYESLTELDLGSLPTATKSLLIVNCAFYNRNDNPEPDLCDWYVTPAAPEGRVEAADDHMHEVVLPTNIGVPDGGDGPQAGDGGGGQPIAATGGGLVVGVIGVGLIALATRLRRQRA